MTFGQQSGPTANARQVARLLALVQQAGHVDFADARHPLGLTQRQAKGKFTVGEAEELIATLEAELEAAGAVAGAGAGGPAPTTAALRASSIGEERRANAARERQAAEHDRIVRGLPASVLADELVRRGWAVVQPD